MNEVPGSRVVIVGVDMTLGQLVVFIFKVTIASIPAVLAIWVVGLVVAVVVAAIAGVSLL